MVVDVLDGWLGCPGRGGGEEEGLVGVAGEMKGFRGPGEGWVLELGLARRASTLSSTCPLACAPLSPFTPSPSSPSSIDDNAAFSTLQTTPPAPQQPD